MPRVCDFCGHNEGDERHDVIIYGPTSGICNDCIEQAAELVKNIRIKRAVKAARTKGLE